VVFETLAELEDSLVIEHLTKVKGIGVWTAQMFLMFALRRTDVLPVGDLGIRAAMKRPMDWTIFPNPPRWKKSPPPGSLTPQ